jgi:hypothetical protein
MRWRNIEVTRTFWLENVVVIVLDTPPAVPWRTYFVEEKERQPSPKLSVLGDFVLGKLRKKLRKIARRVTLSNQGPCFKKNCAFLPLRKIGDLRIEQRIALLLRSIWPQVRESSAAATNVQECLHRRQGL